MKTHPPLHALDVRALCRDGIGLNGHWPLAGLQRLADSLAGAPPREAQVQWSVQGSARPVTGGEPELWLHLHASAAVRLQCQRCLQPMDDSLQVDRHFRFVRHEQEAERLDEEIEDDVLVLPVRLDLPELLEDELILALPLVPRHAQACPQPLPIPPAEPDTGPALDPGTDRPHPFAALAALRKRGGTPAGG